MSAPVHLHSEPYQATGNIDARAASKAIGRPRLPHWHVFLRETIQNSWDARLTPAGIRFSIDAWTPQRMQAHHLRTFFALTPPPSAFTDSDSLDDFLEDLDEQTVLVVSDRRTRGLGGPTRADQYVEGRTDFVDFVRNIGRDASKSIGGGTYGFGKAILWRSSMCSTVLVYSRTRVGSRYESRMIAVSLTSSYDEAGMRFTGRHWWGMKHPDTGAEPFRDADADRWAERLGLEVFAADETGTSLMVMGPIAEERGQSLQQVMASISDAVLWWCWPHLVDRTIDVSITAEGEPVPVPDPREHPRLKHFAGAYERRGREELSWPWSTRSIRNRHLGTLGELTWRLYQSVNVSGSWEPEGGARSHVALMRKPRFIVKYENAREAPEGVDLAGVFVAADGYDGEFAAAEPVAHEDWTPDVMGLAKGQHNPVRIALRRIAESLREEMRSSKQENAGERKRDGVNQLAGVLGAHVGLGVDASSPRTRTSTSSGGRPRRKPVIDMVDAARLGVDDAGARATFSFTCAGGAGGGTITLSSGYVLDGGGVDETRPPGILGVRVDGARVDMEESTVQVGPGDHAVEVDVRATARGIVTLKPEFSA